DADMKTLQGLSKAHQKAKERLMALILARLDALGISKPTPDVLMIEEENQPLPQPESPQLTVFRHPDSATRMIGLEENSPPKSTPKNSTAIFSQQLLPTPNMPHTPPRAPMASYRRLVITPQGPIPRAQPEEKGPQPHLAPVPPQD